MGIKSINGTTCTCLAVISFNVNASIISTDWRFAGDNLITQDTDSGLDWLDLTETTNMSRNDVIAQLGIGGALEGWRYAIHDEIVTFFDAFGGNSAYYNSGWTTQNNGLFDAIAPYWGDTYAAADNSGSYVPGDLGSEFLIGVRVGPGYAKGEIYDCCQLDDATMDYVKLPSDEVIHGTISDPYMGHALVRVSAVPVPAAAWLFSTGIIGLVGLAKRKKS